MIPLLSYCTYLYVTYTVRKKRITIMETSPSPLTPSQLIFAVCTGCLLETTVEGLEKKENNNKKKRYR